MRATEKFLVLLLVGLSAANPVTVTEEESSAAKITITDDYYSPDFLKYTGEHEIVNILVPFDLIKFENKNQSSKLNVADITIDVTLFFVEADMTPEGKRIDKGLYALKNGKATKLLDNGRDAAAGSDETYLVFFGASDGIYVYKNGTMEKYGSLTDSIIGIAKQKSGDGIYILTEDHEVYNVTDAGNKKEKVDSIVNAKQIVLDESNNLYFRSDDKQVYVLTSEGIKKLTGIPENASSVTLVKPPFVFDEGLPVIVDNYTCMAYPNGTCERGIIEFEPNTIPTAFGSEAALIQYYARDKKIYEYNLFTLLDNSDLEELQTLLTENAEMIESLASQTKTENKDSK